MQCVMSKCRVLFTAKVCIAKRPQGFTWLLDLFVAETMANIQAEEKAMTKDTPTPSKAALALVDDLLDAGLIKRTDENRDKAAHIISTTLASEQKGLREAAENLLDELDEANYGGPAKKQLRTALAGEPVGGKVCYRCGEPEPCACEQATEGKVW